MTIPTDYESQRYCPHCLKDRNEAKYALWYGGLTLVLCRACYGEIVIQIIESLMTVRVSK